MDRTSLEAWPLRLDGALGGGAEVSGVLRPVGREEVAGLGKENEKPSLTKVKKVTVHAERRGRLSHRNRIIDPGQVAT